MALVMLEVAWLWKLLANHSLLLWPVRDYVPFLNPIHVWDFMAVWTYWALVVNSVLGQHNTTLTAFTSFDHHCCPLLLYEWILFKCLIVMPSQVAVKACSIAVLGMPRLWRRVNSQTLFFIPPLDRLSSNERSDIQAVERDTLSRQN